MKTKIFAFICFSRVILRLIKRCRNLITEDEMSKLNSVLESPDSAVMAQSYEEDDGEGKKLRLTLWNHPGSDITGMINRSERVVNTCKEVKSDLRIYKEFRVKNQTPMVIAVEIGCFWECKVFILSKGNQICPNLFAFFQIPKSNQF